MPANDKPRNGQDRPNGIFDVTELLPPPALQGKERLVRLRTAWKESWKEDGFLHQRWEDLSQARYVSWHELADWIKATGLLAGLCLVVIMVDTAGDIASTVLKGLSAVPATGTGDGNGLWGTVDHPIRVFLTQQAAHLAVAPAALYTFWQLTGVLGLIGGFFGNAGARIAWVLFGCGNLAMVWSASPAGVGTMAWRWKAGLNWYCGGWLWTMGRRVRPRRATMLARAHMRAASPVAAARPPAGEAD
ncbi:hypothetical protein, partial [Streptomyces caniscabiei]|uniref:hypothetical protein n=1 Tax=Streptomyces caniscabiei TaxID=2746961 RepID=UPI0015C50E4A